MSPRKIVVRMPNWVGDAVLAAPALRALRDRWPDAEIWAAARPWVSDLFAAGGVLRGVVPVDDLRGLRGLRASAAALRSSRFDLGLLLTNSFASALLFRWAGIPERWGAARDARGPLLTRRARPRPRLAPVHQRDYYLEILAGLGVPAADRAVSLAVAAEDQARADEILAAAGRRDGRPLVALGFGSSYGPAKRWPAVRFAELARIARRETGAEIALVGAAEESGLAADLAARMDEPPLDLAGRTTLRELMGVLARASLFVTNDTGPMHIAAALGVPVVAVFGPTDPAVTGPLSARSAVVKKGAPCWPCLYRECPFDHRCMLRIDAEEVWEAGSRIWP